MANHKIELTVLSSLKPETLTKHFSLVDGKLQKSTSANLYEGFAHLKEISGLDSFADFLQRLEPNNALCYGVLPIENAKLVTKNSYENLDTKEGVFTRSKEHFKWGNGPGIFMLDYDPQDGQAILDETDLIKILTQSFPELRMAGYVWWVSSSSYIYTGDIEQSGLKGQRVYFIVKSAQDIERAGKVLIDRLWLNGYGRLDVGVAGQLLERTVFDANVWQSNRIDFAAGAVCSDGVEQRRGKPKIVAGDLVDTVSVFRELTPGEKKQLEEVKTQKKREVISASQRAKEQYIERRAVKMAAGGSDEQIESARVTVARALDNKVLTGDFELVLDNGDFITVSEVLENPNRYHKAKTKDPIEPEYNNSKTVGILYLLGSAPRLFSQAHGGQSFTLLRQPRMIELKRGRTTDAVYQVLEFLREQHDLFDKEGLLIQITDGVECPIMEVPAVTYMLASRIQFYSHEQKSSKTEKVLKDPPETISKQLLSLGSQRRLKQLKAVVTAPVITREGRLLQKNGYDSGSRLCMVNLTSTVSVPEHPTRQQLQQALAEIWVPFADFPLCGAIDKGVLLAAIFTAVTRPVLDIAPAIGFDAPVQGSGKTLLARTIGAICTGKEPTIWPDIRGNNDEIRKRLFALCMSGERVLIWDNVMGVLQSSVLAGFLTGPFFGDRILGQSRNMQLPNNAFILFTGNNLRPASDLVRRVIKCRIAPDSDKPYRRKFPVEPTRYVKEHREKIIEAVLTVIRGYQQQQTRAQGSTASYEQWDELVRQPVAWVGREFPDLKVADPVLAIDKANEDDPDQLAWSAFLEKVFLTFGSKPFSSSELQNYIQRPDGVPGSMINEWVELTGGRVTAHSIGRQLGYKKDRISGGLKLENPGEDKHKKVNLWRVVKVA